MATYGYARVSREDQELALQVDALVAAGVAPGDIVREKMSGVADRPRFANVGSNSRNSRPARNARQLDAVSRWNKGRNRSRRGSITEG